MAILIRIIKLFRSHWKSLPLLSPSFMPFEEHRHCSELMVPVRMFHDLDSSGQIVIQDLNLMT